MTIFDDDRSWLDGQPGMNDWNAGCARLKAQLCQWLSTYFEAFGIRVENRDTGPYLARMWRAWSWHWQMAVECGHEDGRQGLKVAESIRAGRGYAGHCKLGGDPLRDVVLAEAVCQRAGPATEQFTHEYAGLAVGVARKFSPKSIRYACTASAPVRSVSQNGSGSFTSSGSENPMAERCPDPGEFVGGRTKRGLTLASYGENR